MNLKVIGAEFSVCKVEEYKKIDLNEEFVFTGHTDEELSVGIFIFREPATFWRLFFLTTLIGSIIGLNTLS